MGVTFIKRSTIPVSVKGKPATSPSVNISDKGAITLNSFATKFLNNNPFVAIGFDKGKMVLIPKGAPSLEKLKIADAEFFEFRKAKSKGKKENNYALAGANLLRSKETFMDHIYDFASSGTQTFPMNIDTKIGGLVFDLPKGKLEAKPRQKRTRKAKSKTTNGSGTVASPGETAGTPVGTANTPPPPATTAEEDLGLDLG